MRVKLVFHCSPRSRHESVSGDPRVAGLLERFDSNLEAGILSDYLLCVLIRQEGVHKNKRHVCLISANPHIILNPSVNPYNLFKCSRCCTVRSRDVMLSLTGIVEVGPLK